MLQDTPALMREDTARTRAGYVLLAGLPNAGKSTLLNALIGEHLSIVTPKAQTTWQRVAGIRTDGRSQMVLIDTPGIVTGRALFHRSMLAEALGARDDADVAVGVVDGAARYAGKKLDALFGFLRGVSCPVVLAVNKADHPRFSPVVADIAAARFGVRSFTVSSKTGRGMEALVEFLQASLPESPFLFPGDDIAVAPTRFFVQELIRETIFEQFRDEIPYSVAVQVEDFRDDDEMIYIAVAVYVERKSQKGMLIGKRGAGIKALGAASRRKLEHFLGSRVYLDVRIRVAANWRRKKEGLIKFGYRVPADDR